MRPARLHLYFDGPRQPVRDELHLRLALARRLMYPAEAESRSFGRLATTRLRSIAENIETEIKSAHDAEQPVRTVVDTIRKAAQDAIDRATDQLCSAAKDPLAGPTEDQLARFEKQTHTLRGWLDRCLPCTECEKSPSCRAARTTHSFEADTNPYPPMCLREIAHEIRRAGDFVETLYRDLLPPGFQIVGDVRLNKARRGVDVINGETNDQNGAPLPKAAPRKPDRLVSLDMFLPGSFSALGAFAVYYVAAHELGVHAVQQIGLPLAPSREGSHTKFAEGLVEAAVYSGLATVLNITPALRPHFEGASRRHRQHQAEGPPGSQNRSDPFQIEQGSDLFDRLIDLGQAGIDLGSIETDVWDAAEAPGAQVWKVIDGKDWARGVVLALNVLPLDRDWREAVVECLDDQLQPGENFRALLQAEKEAIEESDFGYFFNTLDKIRLNPWNGRARAQLEDVCRVFHV